MIVIAHAPHSLCSERDVSAHSSNITMISFADDMYVYFSSNTPLAHAITACTTAAPCKARACKASKLNPCVCIPSHCRHTGVLLVL
jgi:hypothetical protein